MKSKSKIIEVLPKGIYREENGKKIFGKTRMVFIYNLDYHLINLEIYEDGKIDCWDLVDFNEFKKKVASGWIQTSIPEGSQVDIFLLGRFNIKNSVFVKEGELIKEIQDTINELNNKPTSMELCRVAYDVYNSEPSKENESKLKIAYENMPEHLRHFVLGDMNNKDYPIRKAIYNEE